MTKQEKAIRNKKIVELYDIGIKQIRISEIFNLSKQRIKQIILNRKALKTKTINKLGKKICFLCYSTKKIEIHHLNNDPSNNDISNLIYLCKKHHIIVHNKTKKYKPCNLCGDDRYKCVNRTINKVITRLCTKCNEKHEIIRKNKTIICIDCKNICNHHAKNRCKNCYYKYIYKTNPKRREYIRKKSYEWKENNPERWKALNYKALKKYYLKNKKSPI